MKDKTYSILNEKLFDIAILYKVRELEYPPPGSMPIWVPSVASTTKGIVTKQFDPEIWKTYLEEMGIFKLVLSGWFRNEDLDGGNLEAFSFTDRQGQKVDHKWIEENLVIIDDPLHHGSIEFYRLGVPRELALKSMALGYFPDSPSIQNMRDDK